MGEGADAVGEEGIVGEVGVVCDELDRALAGGFDELGIAERLHADVGDPPLFGTDELSGAAQLEVVLGEFEAILCGDEILESLLCLVTLCIRK